MAFIPVYIFILFFTIIIDYTAGILIENATARKRRIFLVTSIAANVGVLAFFKYYNFFTENVNAVLHALHMPANDVPLLHFILPIGLSFHTFQAMSYTIEVYRGNQKAERHFGIYSLYVMFYPQLVAGPIERPQNLLHQFHEPHRFSSDHLLNGLRLMLWGFFKKLVIADRLAQYVNPVFNFPGDYHYLNLVAATLFFTIQIYCDFSGYSDIAIGAARTMGFNLMTNFNRPYFSRNIQEFWAKWHISLSTWFKDYLYIPLGGNRGSNTRTYINVAIVFIVSGLWHGASWTFIVWGALHSLYILTYMFTRSLTKKSIAASGFSNLICGLFTFCIVAFAWIFFRAANLADASLIVKHIFTLNHTQPFRLAIINPADKSIFSAVNIIISLLMITLLFGAEAKLPSNLSSLAKKPVQDIAFCTVILSAILLLGVFRNTSFIYFQF